MFPKNIAKIFIIQGFLLSGITTAQENLTIIDPTKNRLFIMPTGNCLSKGTASISFTDIVYFYAGYAPTDFLLINVSGLIPLEEIVEKSPGTKNFSFASKVKILENVWLVKGFSLGGEVIYSGKKEEVRIFIGEDSYKSISHYKGIYDEIFQINYLRETPFIGSLNLTFSLGSSDFQIHTNLAKLFYPTDIPYPHNGWYYDDLSYYQPPSLPFLSYIQFGLEYDISWLQTNGGMKLISEISFNKLNPDFNMMVSGFRFYDSSVSVDVAVAYATSRYIPKYEGILPIISFNFFISE